MYTVGIALQLCMEEGQELDENGWLSATLARISLDWKIVTATRGLLKSAPEVSVLR